MAEVMGSWMVHSTAMESKTVCATPARTAQKTRTAMMKAKSTVSLKVPMKMKGSAMADLMQMAPHLTRETGMVPKISRVRWMLKASAMRRASGMVQPKLMGSQMESLKAAGMAQKKPRATQRASWIPSAKAPRK